MFQGHCGRTGGRRDGSGGESEGGLQVFMDLPSNGVKVCNESNPTFSGKHLTWSMLTVLEALTGETIFHFCSSSFEFLSIFIVSGRSWLPGSTFVGPRSTFQESQVCFLNAIAGSN